MECLGVPVDHRIIKIIKCVKYPPHNDRSSHPDVLEAFSQTAKRRDKPITEGESHLTSELAGPDTRGGVLITLLRPPRNQCFDHGYSAEVSRCRTTQAVAGLINTATNQQLTIDDVSVFDTLPFSPEGSDDDQLVREAEVTFSRMVKAKKPDVVLCCYQGNSSNQFVNALRSIGVGKVFRLPGFKISSDCEVQRINAFHPSYAVNYHATYSCFRRLLLLEFTHAFYNWTGKWQEEPWMEALRSHCCTVAQQVWSKPD
jgi:rhodanese-related sulfurtransferase